MTLTMASSTFDLKTAVLDGLYLFSHSEGHKNYSVSEFIRYLVYPVLQGKICFFYEDGKPIGLVTWCFLPRDVAEQFVQDDYALDENDYVATEGEQLWGIEFIAPFGHARQIMREMNAKHRQVYGHDRQIFWRRFKNRNSIHKGVFK